MTRPISRQPNLWTALASMLTALFIGTAAFAEIFLSTPDGTVSIRGNLISFDEAVYTIETKLGVLEIDAEAVICVGDECPEFEPLNQRIRIAGPDYLLTDLVPGLVQSYARDADAQVQGRREGGQASIEMIRNGNLLADFDFAPQSTSDAFGALLRGDVEIVLSDRPVSVREIDSFFETGLGDLSTTAREAIIAQDGIVPVISPGNRVQQLNHQQLIAVLSGEITNWTQLGGADAPINIYIPSRGNAVADTVERALLEPEFLSFSREAVRLPDPQQISASIANDPNGFGLTSLSTLNNTDPLRLTAACGLPMRNDRFAIKAEDYPLSRRIYMYTANRKMPTRTVKFVNHARETSARLGLNGSTFLGLEPEVAEVSKHGDQLAYALSDPLQIEELDNLRAFAATSLGAERLSMTFRFGSGSSRLDNKALTDSARLADFLSDDNYRDKQIYLIGFTDSIGRSDVNSLLSLRRAEQVFDVIAEASSDEIDLTRVRSLGFGAANPVACNVDEAGRQLNRRVEVWIK